MGCIYGLFAYYDCKVRYVGKTSRTASIRWREHKSQARSRPQSVCEWIRAERRDGFRLGCEILERNVPRDRLLEREVHWCNQFSGLVNDKPAYWGDRYLWPTPLGEMVDERIRQRIEREARRFKRWTVLRTEMRRANATPRIKEQRLHIKQRRKEDPIHGYEAWIIRRMGADAPRELLVA